MWVIEGDHDFGPLTVKGHRQWTRGASNARLVVLDHAGHNAWIDAPDAFRRALSEALASASACRAAAGE